MKSSLVPVAALACLVSASAATVPQAIADQPAQSLPFMAARSWQRSAPAEKIALAADFMRVFCVRPTMSPARLADCLDTELHDGMPFDGAIACIKKLAEAAE